MPSDVFSTYRIERLSVHNLDCLDTLHQAVYGHLPPAGYFQKKYDTGYTGAAYVGYFAFDGSVAAAYYGTIPCYMHYNGQPVLAAQSGDTMTHPDYRNKGLFVALATRTFELCRTEGIGLLFGFPNQHSHHGAVNKLGWVTTETMECFILPVRTLPLAAAARRWKALQPAYRSYSRLILHQRAPTPPGLPNHLISEGFWGVFRDERYLAYKKYSGSQVIRLGQASAWIKIGADLIIGDIGLEDADFGNTIAAIRRTAALLGIRRILFHSSPGTKLYKLFAANYSSIPSFPVLFRDLGKGLDFDNIKFTFADIDIF